MLRESTFFGRSVSGHGFDSVRMIVDLGFNDTDLPDISANVMPGNDASIRVLEKIGFHYGGSRPHIFRGVEQAADAYVLERWQWQAAA